eukprot:TRINITY_DN17387_c0_g1_i1.p1 TRINITY_DN17387_c0_g1~~TRINITY_DN17387_c0_g1_i1.p1  ORF type:complete len:1038 (+),score=215.63 TRINITY_DN17387_c0_g1_i1:303-3416(+)
MQPNKPGVPSRPQYPPFPPPVSGSMPGPPSASFIQNPALPVRPEHPSSQIGYSSATPFAAPLPNLQPSVPSSGQETSQLRATTPLASNGPSAPSYQTPRLVSSVRGQIPVARPTASNPVSNQPVLPPPQPLVSSTAPFTAGPPQLRPNYMQGNVRPPLTQSTVENPQSGLPSVPAYGFSMTQSSNQYPSGQAAQSRTFVTHTAYSSSQGGFQAQSQHLSQGSPQVFPTSGSQMPLQRPFTDPQGMRMPPSYLATGGPPTSGIQELVEEFQSLSVTSVPGSVESGIDPASLPRPLSEADIEDPPSRTIYAANCHSRYLRFTTNAIPGSQSLMSRWHLPLGAVVHPLAESPDGEDIPVIDFGPSGIVRCKRCRTYINPFVNFTDGGRRWRCNVCTLLNDVTGDYFAPLDINGRRQDADQRPELSQGSVEFVAPTEYMVRPPMPPLYFFLIDVSFSAVKSGMLKVAVQTIKSSLDKLPGFPRTQIGFLTFDSTLHFYNLKSTLMQPQMLVVADLEEPFVPLPDDLLVNLSESRSVVESLLDSLPGMFEENVNIESAFGPALKSAFMVMSQLGGKLLIFQNTLPSLGVGRLKLRGDDMRIYGTDKEHTIRNAEDPFYKQMAADLTKYQIGVNLYAFSDKYTDLASLGTLAKYTGGQVYYYPSFLDSLHKDKFAHELTRDLTRETAWEAVMRIRCGKGVKFSTYHGHFMLRSSDLLALPAADCDKAFAMQLVLEDTLLTTQTIFFQVALLYTSSSGERRIRVHTMAVPVVSDLGEMYRKADVGAVMGLLSRLAIEKTLSHKLEEARSAVQLRIVKCLREYRNLFSVQHRLAGRLIYPESLKLLPLYGLALCKCLALRGGFADANIDERSAAGFNIMILPIKKLLKLLYPSLIRIDENLLKSNVTDQNAAKAFCYLPLSAGKLDPTGLYLFDDGFRFIVWLGRVLPMDFVRSLLGVEAANCPDLSKVPVVEQNNELSKKFFSILKILREKDPAFYQHCCLVRQGEQPREGSLFLFNLVEDQIAGMNGYLDWILQIHRQVQQKA